MAGVECHIIEYVAVDSCVCYLISTLALDTDNGLPSLSRCFLFTLAKKKKKVSQKSRNEISNFCGRLPHTRYEAPPQHFVYVPSVAERVVNCGLITAGAHSRCCWSESKTKGGILPFGGKKQEGKPTVTSGARLIMKVFQFCFGPVNYLWNGQMYRIDCLSHVTLT